LSVTAAADRSVDDQGALSRCQPGYDLADENRLME
jgi:hypothetical protein